jgi:3-oxoacyl-[acyl-carrier protein] reductase
LARSKTSSIINISSIIGTNGNQGQLIYGASKAGVIGATLSSAKELASHGIRVNSIAPGFIRTPMTVGLPSELYDQRLSSIAMRRVGEPDDIANVALFLASDLSAYVTGQVIGVDGGMVI